MIFDEEGENFQHILLVVREVLVFKIPPRTTSGGYKCSEWLQSDRIWSGRLRVVSCKERCEIRLEDPSSSELFAACLVPLGERETSVETVLDSSRYFVLKIEDGCGKHAFIGLGFNERNEAFDFNVALSDHEKHMKRENEKEANGGATSDNKHIDIHPALNHRLKEGETIRINVKPKPISRTGMLSSAGLSESSKPNALSFGLAPPPGAIKMRLPLPPPSNHPVAAKISSGGVKIPLDNPRRGSGPSYDIFHIERNHPSTTGSGSTKTTPAGWAAF